ncbi:MAG: DUF192 domain-containing protein [bacterium]|nr:DUF192 domain-containing protein [bacterium]
MKKRWWILIGCILFVGGLLLAGMLWQRVPLSGLQTQRIMVGDRPLFLEVVTSTHDVQQGLGDRELLPSGHGMLFVFSEPQILLFWMRHMRFPLDIIWIRDGRIVDLVENFPAPQSWVGPPSAYQSNDEADMVLELNAGEAATYGLKRGTEIPDLKKINF